MQRATLALLAAATLLLGAATSASAQADLGNDGIDYDCGDFVELNAALGYFAGDGGSAARNVDNLDADRDGVACEPSDVAAEGETPAGGLATLTIRAFTCPAAYAGDDYAGACAAPRAGAALRYLASAPDAEFIDFATGANGSVVVNVLSPVTGGGVTVVLPSGIAGYVVGCATVSGTGEVIARYTSVGFALAGMAAGDAIACDLYYVPTAGTGDGDDDGDGGVVTLPNTGAGPAAGSGLGGLALAALLGCVLAALAAARGLRCA